MQTNYTTAEIAKSLKNNNTYFLPYPSCYSEHRPIAQVITDEQNNVFIYLNSGIFTASNKFLNVQNISPLLPADIIILMIIVNAIFAEFKYRLILQHATSNNSILCSYLQINDTVLLHLTQHLLPYCACHLTRTKFNKKVATKKFYTLGRTISRHNILGKYKNYPISHVLITCASDRSMPDSIDHWQQLCQQTFTNLLKQYTYGLELSIYLTFELPTKTAIIGGKLRNKFLLTNKILLYQYVIE